MLIIPGLAVRRYAQSAAEATRARGHHVDLLRPPTWRGTPTNLRSYGLQVAFEVALRGAAPSVLVGLSVGTQAAATAATQINALGVLLLVSPTVDPGKRTRRRLLSSWLFGQDGRDSQTIARQIPDWAHAGVMRIYAGFTSATRIPLEEVLPRVTARLVIVHAEGDTLSDETYAKDLAHAYDGEFLSIPNASHSWPVDHSEDFADLIDRLLAGKDRVAVS